MEDIKDAFKDHFGYPFSVCRHGDSRKTELNRISCNRVYPYGRDRPPHLGM